MYPFPQCITHTNDTERFRRGHQSRSLHEQFLCGDLHLLICRTLNVSLVEEEEYGRKTAREKTVFKICPGDMRSEKLIFTIPPQRVCTAYLEQIALFQSRRSDLPSMEATTITWLSASGKAASTSIVIFSTVAFRSMPEVRYCAGPVMFFVPRW